MTSSPPDVVMIVLDDMGFADFGCFGSSIETPAIDALAANGLRYNRFHVTPLCSPTRASLLTGRNHHAVEMGMLADVPTDLPGYRAVLPDSAGTVARILRDAGYGTFAVGKWHLAPRHESGADGPFTRWPLGRGFERYYGFLQGMTDQWVPELTRDNAYVEQPAAPEDGYHLTTDLVDQAISMLQDQRHADPEKPFFLYFAPGAMHSPHQAPREWIDRYRGRYDGGWDVERERRLARQVELGVVPEGTRLTPRPSVVASWDELGADERVAFARQMETYAGYLSHTDAEIGRLVDDLRENGRLENTLILIVADNGADGDYPDGELFGFGAGADHVREMAENLDAFGQHGTYNAYARGWGHASNTPFRLWKFYTWLGGVRVPLVLHWPSGVERELRGGVRPQFAHAVDLMPTILDAAGVAPPTVIDGVPQQPIDGASLLGTIADPGAPDPRPHQYFEMTGSRSIYAGGWKATTDHVVRHRGQPDPEGSTDFATDRWALFDLGADFSESLDVGAEHPGRLAELQELWEREAARFDVYPLVDEYLRPTTSGVAPFPLLSRPRSRSRFRAGGAPVNLAVPPHDRMTITMDLSIPAEGSDARSVAGVVAACYGRGSSLIAPRPEWALSALAGELFLSLPRGRTMERIGLGALAAGDIRVAVEFVREPDRPDEYAVALGGRRIATASAPDRETAGIRLLLVGRDRGFATDAYRPPFPFSGRIGGLTIEFAP